MPTYNAYIIPDLKLNLSPNELGKGFRGQFNLFKYCLDQIDLSQFEFDSKYLSKALCEREKIGSTAWGGRALPHTHQPIESGIILLIRFERPVHWPAGSGDGRPINILMVLISPQNLMGVHLKVMAQIDRVLRKLIKKKKRWVDSDTFKNIFYKDLKKLLGDSPIVIM